MTTLAEWLKNPGASEHVPIRIAHAWKDDAGEDLYLVLMEDAGATPTGECLARNCELVEVTK